MNQLTRIRTNEKLRNMKHVVDLAWDGEGQVKATEKKSGDITTYHLKKDDKPHGSIVIWEYPIKDPPFGLYIAGADPYDHDESFTCLLYTSQHVLLVEIHSILILNRILVLPMLRLSLQS